MKNRLFLSAILFLASSYAVFFFAGEEGIRRLTREDGIFEWLGALSLFLASIVFFVVYARGRKGNDLYLLKTRKNLFHLLLGILFFFGAGEEISWGQRIFNLEIPENISSINIQNEFNLHNLEIFHGSNRAGERKDFIYLLLNFDRLFTIFWLSYCVVLPMSVKFNDQVERFIKKINLPLASVSMGVIFVVNYVFSKLLQYDLHQYKHSIVEVKETNFEILFLVVSLAFYARQRREQTDLKASTGESRVCSLGEP